jgi:hypothetical protein
MKKFKKIGLKAVGWSFSNGTYAGDSVNEGQKFNAHYTSRAVFLEIVDRIESSRKNSDDRCL